MLRGRANTSSSGLYGGGERGAGGKFRKPSTQRQPSTPYDRPPVNQSQAAGQSGDIGWISKLVGGATRILPSFFSKSPSPAAATIKEHIDPEVEENSDDRDGGCQSNQEKSEAAEEANTRNGVETLSNRSVVDQLNKRNSLPDGTEFSKIEQLIKEGRFSRDDVSRLLELLHSKVPVGSNVDPMEKKPKTPCEREGKGAVLVEETPQLLFKGKPECSNIAGLRTPVPSYQSIVVDEEVGASPVDIARAYMENRVSEANADSKGTMSKYASKSTIPSPSSKPSVCWPGAMVEDQFGRSTPQSVSSRYGLHQFQRSPYSRSLYSKSKSKLASPEADTNRYQIFSSTRQQPKTPIFGLKSDHVRNDVSGSVGPIRHWRSKSISEASPRGSSSYLSSSQNLHSPMASSISSLPTVKNLEAGASKTTAELKSVIPRVNGSATGLPDFQASNPAVRAILEHLDRHIPTPKDKSAELQLATSSKKSSSFNVIDAVLKEGNVQSQSSFEVTPQVRSEETEVSKDTQSVSLVNGICNSQRMPTKETISSGEVSNIGMKNTNKPSTSQNENKGTSVTNMSLNPSISDSFKKPPHHPFGMKPNLAYISVDKPYFQQMVFSGNNSTGFTFPVSSSSSALPEPPTPSIMPSTTASGPLQSKNEAPKIPTYTFGSKGSTPPLDFSFPFISNASVQSEVSDLTFSFGLNKKKRISFASVGEDAVCY